MIATTKPYKLRKTIAVAISALVAFAGVTLSTTTATAAEVSDPTTINPDANTTLVIHKVEQPQEFGLPANGLPVASTDELPPPVEGASFTATLVEGIDITTDDGWKKATEMTVAEARTIIAGATPDAKGVTDADGTLQLDLKVGLYYIDEEAVPAGVIAAEPFLAVMPMNAPETNDWLYTVHVYPKNPRVTVALDVNDCKAVKLADIVEWTSHSDIPRLDEIDGYVVQNLIVPELELVDTPAQITVHLNGQGAAKLVAADYNTKIVTVEGKQTVEVEFTKTGRNKLAAAKADDPNANVEIGYRTAVLTEGSHVNEVRLFADQRAIEGATPPVTDKNVTKWGPLSVIVHEYGNPTNLIKGAKFKIYLTEEDAIAGKTPVEVDGVSEWTTDEQGRLIVNGLRFSTFANGLDLDKTYPCYQTYWATPTHLQAGWKWASDKPLAGQVNSTVEFETLIFEVVKETSPIPIPNTGGQITGALLLGGVLLIGGAVLFMRRKRKEETID